LVVFDVTRRETFQHLSAWLAEAKLYSNPNISITIVGNKADISQKYEIIYTIIICIIISKVLTSFLLF